MFVHRHGRARHGYYGCVVYHQRGRAVCDNSLEVSMDATDQAVLAAVEHDVLNVAVLETSLYKALAVVQSEPDERGCALREELARLDSEVAQLTQAIAAGGRLTALVAAMQEREQRRSYLRAGLAATERRPEGATLMATQRARSRSCVRRSRTGRAASAGD